MKIRVFALGLMIMLVVGCAQPTPTVAPPMPTITPPTPTTLPPTPTEIPAVTVVDDAQRTVEIKGVPERIISLAPSNTEILFALGLADKIVAVTDMCDYPAEARAKPKVGGFEPNQEQIVAFHPDLVLAVGEYPDLISQLESLGLTVIALQPKDLQGILADIELVGQITGTETRASELVGDMRERIDSIVERVRDAPRRQVFFELDASADSSTPWTAGPGSFAHALIELAGGENVARDAPAPWVQFSVEEIIRSDPQVIILADAKYGVTPDIVTKRPGWGVITAVKKGAIYPIDPDLTTRPGPRIVQGLEEMAHIIHPELFPQ